MPEASVPTVVHKDGKLIITIDAPNPPPKSKSQKTFLIASTGGFIKTGLKVNGQIASLNVVATIPVA